MPTSIRKRTALQPYKRNWPQYISLPLSHSLSCSHTHKIGTQKLEWLKVLAGHDINCQTDRFLAAFKDHISKSNQFWQFWHIDELLIDGKSLTIDSLHGLSWKWHYFSVRKDLAVLKYKSFINRRNISSLVRLLFYWLIMI